MMHVTSAAVRVGRRCADRGTATLEFALILPVLLMLTMGMLWGGIVLNHKLDLAGASREGARYGATIPENQCAITTTCGGNNWAQLVQSVVVDRSNGSLSTAQVCVALVTGSSGSPLGSSFTTQAGGVTNCYNDGNADPGHRVQVKVTREGDSIDGVFFRVPVTLTSSATAKFEQ
ncbi:MAG: TadE/TadG family type IV pilus assembly protein [Acidimicrobiales bacterium]|nr:TadE/TadG family type IV pilus assembly protein [Acidimicrobiales bacterium]